MSYLTYAELDTLFTRHVQGKVARVNHESPRCGGQSKSLRIVETDDGGFSFKCFRCGIGGRSYPSDLARRQAARRRGERIESEPTSDWVWRSAYPSGELSPLLWSRQARDWLLSYVTIDTARQRGPVEAYDRLWLSVKLGETPVKWAGRKLYKEDRVKYLTGQVTDYMVHDPVCPPIVEGKSLVIVEDIVSAWAVAADLKLPAYPLLSTSLHPTQARHLNEFVRKHRMAGVTVWLDNDNAQVHAARRRIVAMMRGYALRVGQFLGLQDPKKAITTMPYSQRHVLAGALET